MSTTTDTTPTPTPTAANPRLRHLRVKIKALAAESRIIRQEERRVKKKPQELHALQEHRKKVVRSAAREALLAYAFLRGIPYTVLEASTNDLPPLSGAHAVAFRFLEGPRWTYADGSKGAPTTYDCMNDAKTLRVGAAGAITQRAYTKANYPEVAAWWEAKEAAWTTWVEAAYAHLHEQGKEKRARRQAEHHARVEAVRKTFEETKGRMAKSTPL